MIRWHLPQKEDRTWTIVTAELPRCALVKCISMATGMDLDVSACWYLVSEAATVTFFYL